jgi:hypothetical protein
VTAEHNDPIRGLLRTSIDVRNCRMKRGSLSTKKLNRCLVSVDIGTPKMASEQTKEATVAITRELTIPTGGDDATPLSEPSAGAAPAPSEAGGSGTLSDLLERERD